MVSRETYDSDAYWRQRYIELCCDMAVGLEEKDCRITLLEQELKKERRKRTQLEAELWNTKNRRKR